MNFGIKFGTVLVTTTLIFTLNSCSSKKNSGVTAGTGNPNVSVDALQVENCLSLEKLASHFSAEDFNFPGRKITTDLSTSFRSDQFFIYNFGVSNTNINSLPFIRKAKQEDCSSVVIENAYGRELHYRIDNYTKDSLSLIRDSRADTIEPIKIRSNAQRTQPELKKIKITLESPTSLLMTLEATTVFPRCSSKKLYDYSKTLRLRWATSFAALPAVEDIHPRLISQARGLIPAIPGAPLIEPSASLLFLSRIAHAEENSEEVIPIEAPPADEPPVEDPVSVTEPVPEEEPPVTETPAPPVAEAPAPPVPPAPPAPISSQQNVQDVLELQRALRQVVVNRSCAG